MKNVLDTYEFSSPPQEVQQRQRKYLKWFDSGGRVLDVGAGRGLFLELLKIAEIQGEGIDINEAAVREATKKGLECRQADIETFLQDKVKLYDGIFCSNVLEHFQPDKVIALLKLFAQALKANGILIIIGPNPRSYQMLTETFWLDPTHVRFYPNLFLSRTLVKLGLVALEAGDDVDTREVPSTLMGWLKHQVLRCTLPSAMREGDEIYLVAQKKDSSG